MIAALVLAAAVAVPPRPSDYVTDNAAALGARTAQSLRAELRSYEAATGHHLIVWIGQTTGDTPLEDWTIRAAEQWKVGRKQQDDGAVLFLFMRDRKVRIEVGYGLEGALPDASASLIIRDTIVPKLREGDVDGAVQSGVDRMIATITPSYAGNAAPAAQSPAGTRDAIALAIVALIFFGVLGLLLVAALFSRRRRGAWYWSGGGPSGGWMGGGFSGGSGGGFSGSFGGGFGGGASGNW